MPSDSNGVYTLPDGYLAITGETILASQHNPPLEDLATSMSNRLMRSGAAPMTGSLKGYGGTVSAPDYAFNSSPTTGIYKTTDGIGVAIGGAMVAEFTSGGLRSGSRFIGELIPYTGTTAQPLTVFPFGQTLSRTTYAALWAFAQTQIATGVNTFYNNGNGTTTFGIGDLRGRVLATKDNLGGVYALRLGITYLGSDPGVVGNSGGLDNHTLLDAQMPFHSHANFLTDNGHVHDSFGNHTARAFGSFGNAGAVVTGVQLNNGDDGTMFTGGANQAPMSLTNAATGGGQAHNNVQPTIICTHLLFAGA